MLQITEMNLVIQDVFLKHFLSKNIFYFIFNIIILKPSKTSKKYLI